MENERYAFFEWDKRFNEAEQVATTTESGGKVFHVNAMGVLYIDKEDISYFINQMRQALDSLEKFS